MLLIYGYRRSRCRRRRRIHFYQIYELNPPNFSNFNLLFMKEFLVRDIFSRCFRFNQPKNDKHGITVFKVKIPNALLLIQPKWCA